MDIYQFMFVIRELPGKQPELVRMGSAPASSRDASWCEAGLEQTASYLAKAVNWKMFRSWKPCQPSSCKHFHNAHIPLGTG